MDRNAEIQALLEKYRQNRCTPRELRLLGELLRTSAFRDEVTQLLGESLLDGIPSSFLEQPTVQESLHRVFNRVMPDETTPISVRKSGRRWKLPVIAAAAAILMSVGMFWYFPLYNQPSSDSQGGVSWDDVQGGGNHAVLTLADGRTIDLRPDQNGIAVGKEVKYLDGSGILPDPDGIAGRNTDSGSALMTLSTPKGGTYRVVLSDGTEVWLNTGSTLTYPAQFTQEERTVMLDGEAFFSVSHQAHVPFRVVTSEQVVHVLGTQFNISAYKEDAYSRTTLVEGSVEVFNKTSGKAIRLDPGTQSIVNEDRITVATADMDAVTGWKKGVFLFNDTELRDAMKQVTRWYDIEVEYEGYVPPTHFFGEIGRDKTLAQVLKIFKQGKVEFRFDEKKNKLIVYHQRPQEE